MTFKHMFSLNKKKKKKNTCELYIVLTRTVKILITNKLVKLTVL